MSIAPAIPELLSPAGNWSCALAAVENGADAIYFGLDRGFNARHRAANFGMADLPELMAMLRLRGVRGYVTMNTLVFPNELAELTKVVEAVACAGVDAVLVQDFGVAEIIREICPQLEVHASTQMSLTSSETIAVAEQLGISRVVLARELSVKEIRKIRQGTTMPLEAFIHGALCVAYSGQCLTSESLGGRSANRGQCAQACRLPYELVCDGEDRDLGDVRYLLSPQDLAGYTVIPELIEAGIQSLKIEGRLKSPEYVANITAHYRRGIDEAMALLQREPARALPLSETQRHEMELSFSRGFAPGWLAGNDHKRLVPGLRSAKQGIVLGEVIEKRRDEILVQVQADVALGDGLAVASHAEDSSDAHRDSGFENNHQGGRVYSLRPGKRPRGGAKPWKRVSSGQEVWIGFGHGDVDTQRIKPGATVFKNDDPQLNRRLAASFGGKPRRTRGVRLRVHAETGKPLTVQASLLQNATEIVASFQADAPLEEAQRHPISHDVLTDKLSRFGGTPFHLDHLDVEISGAPMVPLPLLKQARRELVIELEAALRTPPIRSVNPSGEVRLHANDGNVALQASVLNQATITLLCRNREQLEAGIQTGVARVIADFHDPRTHREAVALARKTGVPIYLASVRIQKPGEMGLIRQLIKYQPDGILARNLAALDASVKAGLPTIADFSLNVANGRSAAWIRSLGADQITASYDLNADQLEQLFQAAPASWFEVVMHQHMPMFHMEHCVFCSVLSPGTNKTNCGRPCDRHVVQLRDRVGKLHPLQADIACRNTLFNATPQSAAGMTEKLKAMGVSSFRIELLDETAEETTRTISLYEKLFSGQISSEEIWQRLAADNRVGVTRGTLEAKRDPMAIL